MRIRIAALTLASLLCACEPSFNVDLVATPLTQDGSSVTLNLDGAVMRKQDGSSEELTRGSTGQFRFTEDQELLPTDLLSNSDIGGGEYSGIRLLLADDVGSVTRPLVADEDIDATDAPPLVADVNFMIDEDEDDTVSLLVALDLPLSLSENADSAGFTLDPVFRAMDSSDAATVRGTIPASRFAPVACTNGTAVVYAFKGLDVTADERDGTAAEPLATAPVPAGSVAATRAYRIDFMPPGDYTLALTCDGQRENGRLAADPGMVFQPGPEVSLEAGQDLVQNFLP